MLNADHTDISDMMNKLRQSGIRMKGMDDDVGAAVTVKELHSDRQKNLLAVYTKKYLDQGAKSATVAEVMARCDPEYSTQFEALAKDLGDANKILRKAKTEDKINDSARSLLSASKRIENDLMG